MSLSNKLNLIGSFKRDTLAQFNASVVYLVLGFVIMFLVAMLAIGLVVVQ